MKFSYNWLKEYLDFDLAPQELADLLTVYSFETVVLQQKKSDSILDIDILPNRFPDAASHFGVAREIKTLLQTQGRKLALNQPDLYPLSPSFRNHQHCLVEVREPKLCNRYTVIVLKNVQVKPSPKWIKDKLAACGVGSINNIVDITNLVMLELGQPLHAFDFDKIAVSKDSKVKKIIVRQARQGEKAFLINNKEYKLDKEMLVIADEKEVLALAGIKGGKKAEINASTKNILIEAAHFDRRRIFSTAKKLRLETDASRRFSAGLDENLTIKAASRALKLILQVTKAKLIAWQDVNLYKPVTKKIKLSLRKAEQMIGTKISLKTVEKLLKAIDCEIKSLSQDELLITVPNYRKDINIPEDLIEEIARLKGYNNIAPVLPYLPLAPVEAQAQEIYQARIRDALKGAGFFEVYNYSFLDKESLSFCGNKENYLSLKNPISDRFVFLRSNLLPGLLMNIKHNLRYISEMRFFEIGKVFRSFSLDKMKKNEEYRVAQEKSQLGIIIALKKNSLFELKGVIELILRSLAIKDFWFESGDEDKTWQNFLNRSFKPETFALIKDSDEVIGAFGEIPRSLLAQMGIKQDVSGAFLETDKLIKLAQEEHEYQEPSKYPPVLRDLSILVNSDIRFSQILNLIERAGGGLVQDVDLFDVYAGANLPRNKKSLAFHIVYQSNDHTLTDKEANKSHRAIEKTLVKELGAVIR